MPIWDVRETRMAGVRSVSSTTIARPSFPNLVTHPPRLFSTSHPFSGLSRRSHICFLSPYAVFPIRLLQSYRLYHLPLAQCLHSVCPPDTAPCFRSFTMFSFTFVAALASRKRLRCHLPTLMREKRHRVEHMKRTGAGRNSAWATAGTYRVSTKKLVI